MHIIDELAADFVIYVCQRECQMHGCLGVHLLFISVTRQASREYAPCSYFSQYYLW